MYGSFFPFCFAISLRSYSLFPDLNNEGLAAPAGGLLDHAHVLGLLVLGLPFGLIILSVIIN